MTRPLLAAVLLAACSGAPPPGPAPAPSAEPARPADDGLAAALAEARAGVSHEGLAELLVDHWRWSLEQQPLWATRLGVHAFDDHIADGNQAAIDARRKTRRELLRRANAIDAASLDDADRRTLKLFREELEAEIAAEVCRFEHWNVSPRSNPVTEWNHLPEVHRVASAADAANLVSRYRQIARSIDDEVALLRVGLSESLVATRESVARIVQMVERQLAQPLEQWPMLAPAKQAHPQLAELPAIVEQHIKPALERYHDFLKHELLPRARSDEQSGLGALSVGAACYRARIRHFTTLELSADAIHALGLEEIARIDTEIAALGRRALGTDSLAAALERLRTDPALYFDSADAIVAAAEQSLALAKARIPEFFGLLPRADCVVRPIPDYEAPYTTIAYYRPPHTDGSKPGAYLVNVYRPETRPRFEARVLAIHESIPGHHLQIAIAQQLPAVPAFRKHGLVTAYVEGWALYTERLGETMGLYATDLDRLGMLSFDAWRAGRLVVDTGIHHKGWSRGQAERFLLEHSALSPDNIDNEVDRYISWPGQALGYKIGQLEIARLRAEAEQALGSDFSLPAFHDAVLSTGPVTLPVLRESIAAYIDGARRPGRQNVQ